MVFKPNQMEKKGDVGGPHSDSPLKMQILGGLTNLVWKRRKGRRSRGKQKKGEGGLS